MVSDPLHPRWNPWHPRTIALFLLLSSSLSAADLPPGCLARLGDTRFRHPGPVTSLAFHPDGKTLVAHADGDRVARVWSVPGGELVAKVAEPRFTRDITRVVGFAANGKRLVLLNDDDEALTLEPGVETKEIARWSVRQVVTLSRDGSLAAGADTQGRAAVWRTDSGEKLLAVGNVPERKKLVAAFSPDGRRVAFGGFGDANTVHIHPFDGQGKPLVVKLDGPATQIDWPTADRLMVRFTDSNPKPTTMLMPLDLVAGRAGAAATDHAGVCALFPDGTRRASVSDGLLRVEQLDPAVKLVWSDKDRGDVKALTVSVDAKRVAAAVGVAVRLFDADTGAPQYTGSDPFAPAEHLAVSADGTRVLAAGGGAVRLWDVDANKPLHTWPTPRGEIRSVALTTDGRSAVAAGADATNGGAVTVWDAGTGQVRYRTEQEGRPFTLFGFDAAGRVWFGGRGLADPLKAIDPATGTAAPLTQPVANFGGYGGTLSVNGRFAVTRIDGHMAVRGTADNGPWKPFPTSQPLKTDAAAVLRTAISPTGRHVATTHNRGLLGWPVHGPGREVAVNDLLPAAIDRIQSLAFTADGRLLVWSRSNDAAVRFWDVHVWGERFRFEPPGGVKAFALSADGRRLVVAHPDGTLSVWDARRLEDRGLPADERLPESDVWEKLGSPDARVGLVAVRTLAARPDAAVKLLSARMPVVEPTAVARLVAELDSPKYPLRELATRKLAALGEAAEGAVRAAAGTSRSAEVRRRAAEVLTQYQTPDGRLPPALLRAVRAVEVLERIGSPAAVELLKAWAGGEGSSLRAVEAAEALGRLKIPSSRGP